jgi:hypothetical protein
MRRRNLAKWEQHRKEKLVTKPKNSGTTWAPADVSKLRDLARGNTPTRVIGLKLRRTPDAVAGKASREGVSLKPTNQSPYSGRKP